MFRQLILPVRAVLQNCGFEMRTSHKLADQCGKSSVVSVLSSPSSSAYHTSSVLQFGRKLNKRTGSQFVERKATADGENASITELHQPRVDDRFPDIHLPTRDFSGTMFKDLPIVNVKASMNNTLINVTDPNGLVQTMRSCGYDGFKNARKGTNVAAQATGFTFGKKLMQRGLRVVRVRVAGLGPGRLASIRGLSFAGVNVVSITDSTPVSWNAPRARKQRRL